MLTNRLIQLIENHSDSLTQEALHDMLTNEYTASLRKIPRAELKPRIASLYQNLGKWLGCPDEDDIRQEYEDWGRTRFKCLRTISCPFWKGPRTILELCCYHVFPCTRLYSLNNSRGDEDYLGLPSKAN